MLDRSEFLKEYNISEESFSKSTCNWSNIEAIFYDFCSKGDELLLVGNQIQERLRLIKEVHSLKMRIKNPKHLIEKIIRKKIEDSNRQITPENYFIEITDLIGVRALHLFKDDWIDIHHNITNTWELHEPPVAYIRKGDPEQIFTNNGCEIKAHEAGYRSVHYLIKSKPTKKQYITEIQVRTIFEEGWSEIDHRLRYPYDINNMLLNEYLKIFNRLAGSADEMGSYIKFLKFNLSDLEAKYENKRKQFNRKKEKTLKDIEKLKDKFRSRIYKEEELQLNFEAIIGSLKKLELPLYNQNIIEEPDEDLVAFLKFWVSMWKRDIKCVSCGHKYEILISARTRESNCPVCGAINLWK